MRPQRTIRHATTCTGMGLHSGKPVSLTLQPAPSDTGIVFVRKDLGPAVRIPASIKHLRPALLSTVIGIDNAQVHTIEHLLAAATGLEVDNLYVEVDAAELPVLDGSAALFVRMLQDAGPVAQERPRPYLKIVRPIEVREGNKQIAIYPARWTSVTYTIDYPHPLIGRQRYRYRSSPEAFARDIAPARTFGFLREVKALWEAGLGLGGSLENTLVLSDDGLVNQEGLRFHDEFVRHKVLDLIGDMSLLGLPFIGEIVAVCSGHALHARLVAAILASHEHWMLVSSERFLPAGRTAESLPALVASPQRD